MEEFELEWEEDKLLLLPLLWDELLEREDTLLPLLVEELLRLLWLLEELPEDELLLLFDEPLE